MRGQPITLYEREKIELFTRGHWSMRRIAKMLYRDHYVIVREINRNKDSDGIYRAKNAHNKALKRLNRERKRKLDTDDALREWVIQKIYMSYKKRSTTPS